MTARSETGMISRPRVPTDVVGIALIAAAGVAGYLLFPDNLAFLTRVISIALLVLSLDLVTGYCGIASLGQGFLYGAGAYAAGIAAVGGVTDPVLLLLIGAAAGAVVGVAAGAILIRAHGLPQLVLSIALVQLGHEAANKAAWLTGGSDGLYGIAPDPLIGLFAFDLYGRTAYVLGLLLLVLVFATLTLLVRTPFGITCRGIRQDPVRVAAMGIGVAPVLIKMFAVSGAVAGLGGALGALASQVVGLDSVSFELSANALVMLVIGGLGTLWGALLGSVVFLAVEHVVSAINPFHWMTLVGLMLIAVVLFAPGGLAGLVGRLRRRGREGR
jgi:branched-chain amino acid transport system permease protein